MTIQYYQDNAKLFFDETVNVDMSPFYSRFLKHLRPNVTILDAGCGSGRDSKAFLDKGFNVIAMDASSEMVKLASGLTGLNVKHSTFDQVTEESTYDAIWCCASLLHVSEKDLPHAMSCLNRSLKKGGYWYLSFKYGDSERLKDDRHFTDMNEVRFEGLLSEIDSLIIVDRWLTVDARPDRNENWLNLILKSE